MTTATFANGFTRTYKGRRAVKAAWMITANADGRVITSGFSWDEEAARKTAATKIQEEAATWVLPDDHPLRRYAVTTHVWKGCGFPNVRAAREHMKARRQEVERRITIHVIALSDA